MRNRPADATMHDRPADAMSRPPTAAFRLRTALALALALAPGGAAAVDEGEPKAPPVHDPANDDYRRLQPPAEAFDGLPLDKRGRVDWMRALRAGLIKPRADVKGEQTMQVFNLDIVMKNTAEMPWVKFPHDSHTMWLDCSNCHDAIFVAKAGANPINMTRIFRGEYCGVCHDRVAFTTMFACERCHSVLRKGEKAWWEAEPAAAPSPPAGAAPSPKR